MNYFKEKKFATIAIIILVILNIVTISLLWLGRPSHHRSRQLPREKILFDFIAHELELNPVQRLTFENNEKKFMDETKALHFKIDSLKQKLYNTIYEENTDQSMVDSLSAITGNLEAEINKLTYYRLLEIKNLCNGNQQLKYKTLLKDILETLRPKQPLLPPPPPPVNE